MSEIFSEKQEFLKDLNTLFNADHKTICYLNLWNKWTGKQPFSLRNDLKDEYNDAINNAWEALCRIEIAKKSDFIKKETNRLREAFKVFCPTLFN